MFSRGFRTAIFPSAAAAVTVARKYDTFRAVMRSIFGFRYCHIPSAIVCMASFSFTKITSPIKKMSCRVFHTKALILRSRPLR